MGPAGRRHGRAVKQAGQSVGQLTNDDVDSELVVVVSLYSAADVIASTATADASSQAPRVSFLATSDDIYTPIGKLGSVMQRLAVKMRTERRN